VSRTLSRVDRAMTCVLEQVGSQPQLLEVRRYQCLAALMTHPVPCFVPFSISVCISLARTHI
jgi:hypothetical protein